MMHTDSNQHVNSLTYPRIFEEAALRRIMQDARIPSPHELLARAVEVRWRRPFFAGQRARIALRLLDGEGEASEGAKIGAVGVFRSDGPKPSCAMKMLFR